MIDLSIIIVNYNVKEFLLNLLESIQRASKNLSTEVIVVDNNSDDDSIKQVNLKFPSVITIENKENVGFGIANNQGLEICKGKFILLINPDTLVREDTFEKMINFLSNNSDIGLAGCKVLNPDGTLQLACRRSFPRPWVSLTKVTGLSTLFPKSRLLAKYNLTYLDENESNEVDAISGSFMFLRREVYEEIGGFDTAFFMYGEDLDLCYRVQQSGKKVYYVSETEIIHYKGESTKRSNIDETKVFYSAMHLFVRKHFSSSFIIEAILQFGILLRKTIAFANVNKYIILAAILDFSIFYFLIQFSEKIYANNSWIGFPEIFKPWVYVVPALFQVIVAALVGAYKRNSLSVLRSLISLFIGFVFITSSTFFLKEYAFSRAVVLITFGFSAVLFSLWRIVIKYSLLKTGLSEVYNVNAVIVGIDKNAKNLSSKLLGNLSSPYKLLGMIGNNINEIGSNINELEVIGTLDNLKKIIREKQISNVIFSSESVEFDEIFSTVAECQGENVNFMISGNELDYMVGKSNITHIEKVPLVKVHYNISLTVHKWIKRIFDFILSFILMIFLFPLVFVVSKLLDKKGDFIKSILNLPLVFKGEKSFVGPQILSDNKDLFLGKIGLTGLWFIDNLAISDKAENKRLDLFYAKNQNIWLDLEIIGKSIAKYLITRGNNG